jgi:phosphoribosylformylglycinamidine cyclo-ligase
VTAGEQTYAAAGVSLATADAIVERLRAAVESTRTPGAVGAFGAFAGLYAIDESRLLAASTDSIGTKPIVARRRGALRACGADMAAHCINDVITTGADPLFLLDYVAAARIDPEQVAELVEGAAEVCRKAGVMLLGGETAELPDVYREEELDFAATCVGIVERDRLVDGSAVEEDDVVVGLASAGVHANGFTLVRRVLELEDYDGADLLAPTRLYLDDVRRLRGRARAFAHVTGGGIEGNLRRALPPGLDVELDWNAWERPPVFHWLARHVDEAELRRVFNLGIGYCAVVPEAGEEQVIGRIVRA